MFEEHEAGGIVVCSRLTYTSSSNQKIVGYIIPIRHNNHDSRSPSDRRRAITISSDRFNNGLT